MKDLTTKQYIAALRRNGLSGDGYLGYVHMPCGLGVGLMGGTFRQRLAYFLRRLDEHPGPNSNECPGCIKTLEAVRAARAAKLAASSDPKEAK